MPFTLSPADPPLLLDEQTTRMLHTAESGQARLELAGEMLPSLDRDRSFGYEAYMGILREEQGGDRSR